MVMKHDVMRRTGRLIFFFPVSLKLCVNCCQRCVRETHTLILSSSGLVQPTDWEVKGHQVRPK